ncbi:hypothetical protein V3C99_016131, partial [Haemonchus contortus]
SANMATTATSAYHVAQLIDKMMSVDKDYRFMAVNDLMRELQTNNMRLDDDSEKKVVRMLIRLLDDNNGEVQNLAVKCLGTVTQRVKEAQAETLVDALCSMMVAGSESLRDVSSIALKTVVGHLPVANTVFVTNLMKRLVPKLNAALEQTKPNDSVRLEVVDVIGDVLTRFGSLIAPVHRETQKILLDQLLLERPALKKKSTLALSAMMAVCSTDLFKDTMDVFVERLSDAKGTHSVRTYVVALTCVAKSNGPRFAEYIPRVVPKIIEQVEAADDDELKEALLQSLETFLYRCPREMAAYQDQVLRIVTTDLTYDPNYSYSDDEEEQSMEIGDGDTDEDDAEDYSDDDDMSWKVRRASAKTIEAMIVSRRDQLSMSVQTLGPLLISRLREREENVRIDIYNAYIAILSQARLVVPNALAALHKDDSEEPIKIGTTLFSPSALSGEQQQLLEAIAAQSEPLLKAVMKQLRLKSPKTRSLCFDLLANFVRTLPGSLASYLPSLLPGLSNAVLDRSSGAPMKIDALSLLARVIKCHDNNVFAPHLESIVQLTVGAIQDSFYKVSAEGLSVASLLVPVIRDCGSGNLVPTLYNAIFEKLKINDIDQEVKERAIYAAGLFIATFADDMPAMVPTTLELMMERLRNEMTRLYAVRALIMIAESRNPLVDISPIVPFLLPTFTEFLKKNSRALRIGTLHLIEALLLRGDISALDSEDLTLIFAELPPLIRESDLQISQLCLKCITVGLQAYPDRVAPQLGAILSSVIHLSQSALLQGATLQASLDMIQTLVSNPVPGKPEFEELLDQLTAPIYDVPNLSRQAFQSISAATGVVAAASGDIEKARSLAEKLADQLQNETSTDAIRLFSVHALGELGRRCPKVYENGHLEPEKLIIPAFNSNSEDLKAAAAQALGALAVGNHARFLPFILNEIQTQPKRQYLLLHALKEVIGHESTNIVPIEVFRSRISEIWPVLVDHADGNEEGTRNVVAECLGKLSVIDPHGLLPELKSLVTSPSARVRSAAVTAVKYMISDEKRPVDAVLQQCIGEFLQTMTDSDLNVRRVALVVLNSAAHNKPSLIRNLLDVLLPSVYSETQVRKELIREVEMGPFKHQVDDGLDLRKSAFECMYTLLESCLEKLEIFEFINYVENGLRDMHHDIRLLSYLMLMKLAMLCPSQLVQRLDKICESLKTQLQTKPKSNAVKQEIDKQDELKRAVIRVVLALQKIPDAERHQQLVDVAAMMRSSAELRALTEVVQRDAMRTFAVGDVPMDTI